MIQDGRHDGAKFVLRQGGNQIQHRRRGVLRLKPHEQPQQRDAGKRVELSMFQLPSPGIRPLLVTGNKKGPRRIRSTAFSASQYF